MTPFVVWEGHGSTESNGIFGQLYGATLNPFLTAPSRRYSRERLSYPRAVW